MVSIRMLNPNPMNPNLELKEYAFAHYIGQKVASYRTNEFQTKATFFIDTYTIENVDTICFLQLRPLSSITDDEAIDVAKLQNWKDYETPISRDDRNGIRDQITVLYKNDWVNYRTHMYLIQQSFALPIYFKGVQYSVERLVELGIYTLKS